MIWRDRIEDLFHRAAGWLYARLRQPRPDEALLNDCKIIVHRGIHDNRTIFENTLAAFERADACGVWGIELDLRWTRDFVPVVFHDADTRRLFGTTAAIAEMTFSEMTERFPLIPAMDQVVAAFGKRRHLMIELKKTERPDASTRNRILSDLLKGLTPEDDFHLISLSPEMFDLMDAFSPQTFLPISQVNIDRFSRMAAQRRYGGVLGHFMLLRNPVVKRHHQLGQSVGTGFVDSVHCLYREVNRRIDWLFTNRVDLVQSAIHPANPAI